MTRKPGWPGLGQIELPVVLLGAVLALFLLQVLSLDLRDFIRAASMAAGLILLLWMMRGRGTDLPGLRAVISPAIALCFVYASVEGEPSVVLSGFVALLAIGSVIAARRMATLPRFEWYDWIAVAMWGLLTLGVLGNQGPTEASLLPLFSATKALLVWLCANRVVPLFLHRSRALVRLSIVVFAATAAMGGLFYVVTPVLVERADTAVKERDFEAAQDAYRLAVRLQRQLGFERRASVTAQNLCAVLAQGGRGEEAERVAAAFDSFQVVLAASDWINAGSGAVFQDVFLLPGTITMRLRIHAIAVDGEWPNVTVSLGDHEVGQIYAAYRRRVWFPMEAVIDSAGSHRLTVLAVLDDGDGPTIPATQFWLEDVEIHYDRIEWSDIDIASMAERSNAFLEPDIR